MLSHEHLLAGEADEMEEPPDRAANYFEQKQREPRERISAPSKNAQIGPRIEIMLNG